MDVKQVLKELGLSEGESKVYLALLKLGPTTVSKITKITEQHRTTIYDFLEHLLKKGLVSYIIKHGIKYYSATKPNKLIEILKEKEEHLKQIMPKLKELAKIPKEEETKVELYKGKEGFKTVLNDLLREGKEINVFGEEGQFQKIFPLEIQIYLREIQKRDIHEKVLVKEGIKALGGKTTEFRHLPKEYLTPTTMVIYGNKTAIIVWKKPYFTILIKNKEIANSNRSYFKILWKRAKS